MGCVGSVDKLNNSAEADRANILVHVGCDINSFAIRQWWVCLQILAAPALCSLSVSGARADVQDYHHTLRIPRSSWR